MWSSSFGRKQPNVDPERMKKAPKYSREIQTTWSLVSDLRILLRLPLFFRSKQIQTDVEQANKQTLTVMLGFAAAPFFYKTYYSTPDKFAAYKHNIMALKICMSAAKKRKKCQLEMQKPFLASAHVLFKKSPILHEQLETLEFHLVTRSVAIRGHHSKTMTNILCMTVLIMMLKIIKLLIYWIV